jgi:hypothetical protein
MSTKHVRVSEDAYRKCMDASLTFQCNMAEAMDRLLAGHTPQTVRNVNAMRSELDSTRLLLETLQDEVAGQRKKLRWLEQAIGKKRRPRAKLFTR